MFVSIRGMTVTPRTHPNKIPIDAHQEAKIYIDSHDGYSLMKFKEHMTAMGFSYSDSSYVRLLNHNGSSYKLPSTVTNMNTEKRMTERLEGVDDIVDNIGSYDLVLSLDESVLKPKEIMQRRLWYKRGVPSSAIKQDTSKLSSVSAIVLCDNKGGLSYKVYESTINTKMVSLFIEGHVDNHIKPLIKQRKEEINPTGRRGRRRKSETRIADKRIQVALLIDNAPVHNREYLIKTLPQRLSFKEIDFATLFIPPYTPDANPAEYIHRMIKNNIWQHIHALGEHILTQEQYLNIIHQSISEMQQTLNTTKIYDHTYRYMHAVLDTAGHSIRAKKLMRPDHLIPIEAYEKDLLLDHLS